MIKLIIKIETNIILIIYDQMDIMPNQIVMKNPNQIVAQNPNVPIVKPKPIYKNIMADLMKPLPKDDTKPNIHLGGGQFTKLDKI